MIVKIQPSNPNFQAAIEYNERKMAGEEGLIPTGDGDLQGIEEGKILATRNVPEGSSLVEEFERLTLLNLKTKAGRKLNNISFHMSVNPSHSDAYLSAGKAVQFIDEVMEALGYAQQPYRIYEHNDIARRHFHVVSCRIGQDGKKISADFERIKLRNKLKELSSKYGFSLVLSDEEQQEEIKASRLSEQEAKRQKQTAHESEKKKQYVTPYDRKDTRSATAQIRDIAQEGLRWHLSTFEQLQALLLVRYRVLLEVETRQKDTAVFFGTDANGKPITPPITENELGMEFLEQIRARLLSENMRNRREQRSRLEVVLKGASEIAGTYEQFETLIAKKGLIIVLSRSRDGQIFGITYLDRATKCAWKASETATDLGWFKSLTERKGWALPKQGPASQIERRRDLPSRRGAVSINPHADQTSTDGSDSRPNEPKGYMPGQHHNSSTKVGRLEDDYDELVRKRDEEPAELVR